jgi:hypothetical protein
MAIKDYLDNIGYVVRDKVTQFEGVAVSINFDLYGCVMVDVRARGLNKEGKLNDGYWFDHKRLERVSTDPVMTVPTFDSPDVPKYTPGQERGGDDHSKTQRA